MPNPTEINNAMSEDKLEQDAPYSPTQYIKDRLTNLKK